LREEEQKDLVATVDMVSERNVLCRARKDSGEMNQSEHPSRVGVKNRIKRAGREYSFEKENSRDCEEVARVRVLGWMMVMPKRQRYHAVKML
jgi:hypothetical protein